MNANYVELRILQSVFAVSPNLPICHTKRKKKKKKGIYSEVDFRKKLQNLTIY